MSLEEAVKENTAAIANLTELLIKEFSSDKSTHPLGQVDKSRSKAKEVDKPNTTKRVETAKESEVHNATKAESVVETVAEQKAVDLRPQLQACLSELVAVGKVNEGVEIISSYNVKRASQLEPKDHAEVIARVKAVLAMS